VGVEGNLNFGSIYGSENPLPNVWSSGNVTGSGSLRARFGYAMDRALIYIAGGYTGANVTGSVHDFGAVPNIFASQSAFLNGYNIGAGLEFAVTNRISIKGEYIYTNLGSASFFPGTPDAISSGISYSTFQAGVNYHF
jgi:outer membrane immunogenic protein